ncbi:MAG: CocE/NonD family hydrolase [Planctomycetota bacterium]
MKRLKSGGLCPSKSIGAHPNRVAPQVEELMGRDWIRGLHGASVLFLSFAPRGRAQPDAPTPEVLKAVDLVWGVKIPMRDGMHLNATLYKPTGMTASLPVILTLTPYIADSYHNRAFYFARDGYVFALVDMRGRGNSEGRFEPLVHDAHDGHDDVEWLAKQTWCDGQVAMWGGSYAGFNQWATVKEFPPHLKTIVPVAAAFPAVDIPFFKNIFYSYEVQWLTFTSGVTSNANLFGEAPFWISCFREMYPNHRPFKDLDTIVGNHLSSIGAGERGARPVEATTRAHQLDGHSRWIPPDRGIEWAAGFMHEFAWLEIAP